MVSYAKKLLVSSALVVAGFSQMAIGNPDREATEPFTPRYIVAPEKAFPSEQVKSLEGVENQPSIMFIVQPTREQLLEAHIAQKAEQIKKFINYQKEFVEDHLPQFKKDLGYTEKETLSLWDIPALFITSLFEDAPRKEALLQNTSDEDWASLLMAYPVTNKEQLQAFGTALRTFLDEKLSNVPDGLWVKWSKESLRKIIVEQDKERVRQIGTAVQPPLQEKPETLKEPDVILDTSKLLLNASAMATSVALGWNVGMDTPLLPLAAYALNILKNGQEAWSLAGSVSSDNNLVKYGLYGLTLTYMASCLVPAVDAASTLTFGTPFQMNTQSPGGITFFSTASAPNSDEIALTWQVRGNPDTVRLSLVSSSGTHIKELQVNTAPVSINVIPLPSVATTNNGVGVVFSNDTVSVAACTYDFNGNPLTSPFTVQQSATGYTAFGTPYVGNLNNTFLMAWGGGSVGNLDTLIRVFSSNGTPLTGQSAINTGGDGSPSVIGLSDGRALVTWFGNNLSSLSANYVSASGTFFRQWVSR